MKGYHPFMKKLPGQKILYTKKPKNQTEEKSLYPTILPFIPKKHQCYQEINQGSDCLIIFCTSVYEVIWVEFTT